MSADQRSLFDPEPSFDGVTIEPARDHDRLSGALARVYRLMLDGEWRSLAEISQACGCTESGASARLRDLRKDRFRERYPNRGVERRNVGGGVWEYRMVR